MWTSLKKLEKNVSTGHPLFEALHQELGIIVNAVNLEEYPIQNWLILTVKYSTKSISDCQVNILLAVGNERGPEEAYRLSRDVLEESTKHGWQLRGVFGVGCCGAPNTSTVIGTTLISRSIVDNTDQRELQPMEENVLIEAYKKILVHLG